MLMLNYWARLDVASSYVDLPILQLILIDKLKINSVIVVLFLYQEILYQLDSFPKIREKITEIYFSSFVYTLYYVTVQCLHDHQ